MSTNINGMNTLFKKPQPQNSAGVKNPEKAPTMPQNEKKEAQGPEKIIEQIITLLKLIDKLSSQSEKNQGEIGQKDQENPSANGNKQLDKSDPSTNGKKQLDKSDPSTNGKKQPDKSNPSTNGKKQLDKSDPSTNGQKTPKQGNNQKQVDPYEVNINGEKYMFVQDQNGNGKTDNKNEILGINDTKENLFQGMKDLDSDKDNIVSNQELKNQGVILAKIAEDGKVDNSQTANVQSVDLNSFKKNTDFNGQGVAGTFNVNTGNQPLQGQSVFEDQNKIQSYLSA